MKDYITEIDKGERRFFVAEVRASKESRTVEGYAALFESNSEMFPGNWQERIAPGAFDEVVNDDTVALFNHDPNFILARNKVNMTITADKKGLLYRFEAPNTTAGNDLLENLRNGNVNSSSFAFTVDKESWEVSEDRNKPSIRTIEKVKRLYDVSPVTYPAYSETSVGLRNFESLKKEVEAKRAAEDDREYKMNLIKHELELFKLKNK